MNENVYVKLGKRLNKNAVKLPLVNSVLNLLRELLARFTLPPSRSSSGKDRQWA